MTDSPDCCLHQVCSSITTCPLCFGVTPRAVGDAWTKSGCIADVCSFGCKISGSSLTNRPTGGLPNTEYAVRESSLTGCPLGNGLTALAVEDAMSGSAYVVGVCWRGCTIRGSSLAACAVNELPNTGCPVRISSLRGCPLTGFVAARAEDDAVARSGRAAYVFLDDCSGLGSSLTDSPADDMALAGYEPESRSSLKVCCADSTDITLPLDSGLTGSGYPAARGSSVTACPPARQDVAPTLDMSSSTGYGGRTWSRRVAFKKSRSKSSSLASCPPDSGDALSDDGVTYDPERAVVADAPCGMLLLAVLPPIS
mmetsp:Transcript_1047/g.1673  ORF Transcript_1047/g.1673 Transcript_1047/m.1673 type:complete len:311 (-) Transcript_1047:653-1585(-)